MTLLRYVDSLLVLLILNFFKFMYVGKLYWLRDLSQIIIWDQLHFFACNFFDFNPDFKRFNISFFTRVLNKDVDIQMIYMIHMACVGSNVWKTNLEVWTTSFIGLSKVCCSKEFFPAQMVSLTIVLKKGYSLTLLFKL